MNFPATPPSIKSTDPAHFNDQPKGTAQWQRKNSLSLFSITLWPSTCTRLTKVRFLLTARKIPNEAIANTNKGDIPMIIALVVFGVNGVLLKA
ncbi:MAG: hypothetical protein KAY84_04760 [Acinetobacter sp.]|nr:hypothetical protein [Acinetobacter sp.]